MLFTLLPFVCLGTGIIIGFRKLPESAYKAVDKISAFTLILLMVTIGGNVGTNEEVISKLGTVGLNCIITCIFAIVFSVLFCYIVEKTILPLEKIRAKVLEHQEIERSLQIDDRNKGTKETKGTNDHTVEKKQKIDPIIYIIPFSVIAGALGCYFFMPQSKTFILTYTLWASLIVLYTSVGIGLGENKKVFIYLKVIGFRILYLVIGIFLGSIAGGVVSSLITGMPLKYAVISASGMGYYSMTGATMLQAFGPEAGVYGFMVNVFRDFFTVMLLPILARVGKSAPIASGAAGNMDTMLVPVTKIVGKELGLVALIVGVVITFAVPFILPVFCNLL
ncbi:MAG: lysine exporter LysO family protein [Anaerovoracaceae bacterium]